MSFYKPSSQPPGWAIRILSWFCADHLVEGILGDLLEQFEEEVEHKGIRKARILFIMRVIRLIHPVTMSKSWLSAEFSSLGLLANHFKVSVRSMKKYKFYAFVNVLGLSLAVAFVYMSYLFIQHERSYDQFHAKKDRTYRIYQYSIDPESTALIDGSKNGCTPIPLLGLLSEGGIGIQYHTRFGSNSATIFKDQVAYDEVIAMADPDFFEMFDFPIINGSKYGFNKPNVVFLSEEKSLKYFGDENPIGQSLEVMLGDSSVIFQVEGVVDNMHSKTSLNFDFVIPFEHLEAISSEASNRSFRISFIESFVTLDAPLSNNHNDVYSAVIGDKMDGRGAKGKIGLQPLTDIHFSTDIQGMYPGAGSDRLWLLGGLAMLVLVVSIINFVTLSVGHSMHRVREVGLRRVFGAGGSNLRTQLMMEVLSIAFLASLVAVFLVLYLLPDFNVFAEVSLDYNFVISKMGFIVMLILGISIITGGIQALVLTGYSTFAALKGGVSPQRKKSTNHVVIVFQFAVAILLVFGTMVIHQQMAFIQTKDLGFDKDQIIEIVLQASEDFLTTQQDVGVYVNEIEKHPEILSTGASMNSFREPWTRLGFRQEDQSELQLYFNLVDKAYVETMDMKIVLGSSFSNDDTGLFTDVLVNETFVKMMNWDDPIGKQIPGNRFEFRNRIVGVVKDFHFGSLHEKIQPMILVNDPRSIESGITGLSTYVWPPNLYNLAVRLGPGDVMEQITFLENSWQEIYPDKAFTFNFVDDVLASKYAEEMRWRKLANFASLFALGIAWLGLLGLTRLSVQRRIKEIGIRKVLGSSIMGVTKQLSQNYILLVALSCISILPLGWWVMQEWLSSFDYRIDLSPFTFIAACLAVLSITIVSVVIQGYRAALANPVDVLRAE